MLLVSVEKTEETGNLFLVPMHILKIKECHVFSFWLLYVYPKVYVKSKRFFSAIACVMLPN